MGSLATVASFWGVSPGDDPPEALPKTPRDSVLRAQRLSLCRWPEEVGFLRGIREEGDERGFVLEALKGGAEVRAGRPRTATGPCSPPIRLAGGDRRRGGHLQGPPRAQHGEERGLEPV